MDLENLKDNCKSGFVAILGRPNVGKSTLLNALVGSKVSIVSQIPQTTRYQIKGILNLENAQIVFVDTPGIHSFKDNLTVHLNTIAKKSLDGCDLLIYVADTSRPVGREEEKVVDILVTQKVKVIMVLNKMDLGAKFLNEHINFWKIKIDKKKITDDPLVCYLPLCAKTGKNVDTLREIIIENLPFQPFFYDKNTVTDFPLKFRISDVVREKLFLHLQNELPHSLAVEVDDDIEEKETTRKEPYSHIRVIIYINRTSQKRIIIGKGGSMLELIGKESRLELEKILGKKVYLDIWVKVLENWQEKTRILKELGYWWV